MEKRNRQTPKGSTAYYSSNAKIGQKSNIPKIERIRQHLVDGKPITPIGALEMFGSFSLKQVVFALRKRGYRIKTTIVLHPSTGSRFAMYQIPKTVQNEKR